MRECTHLDVDVDETAKTPGQRRQAGVQVGGVGQNENVRLQPVPVRTQEPLQARRADLLLSLDEDAHVDRQRSCRLEPRADRSDVDQDPGLVVDYPSTVDAPVRAECGLERSGVPTIESAGWLDVVVRVEKCRGCLGSRAVPLGHDRGMLILGHAKDVDTLKTGLFEESRHFGRRALDFRGIEARRGYARDPRQGAERVECLIESLLENLERGVAVAHLHARNDSTRAESESAFTLQSIARTLPLPVLRLRLGGVETPLAPPDPARAGHCRPRSTAAFRGLRVYCRTPAWRRFPWSRPLPGRLG
jgi:hypothetical protein